MWKCDYGHINGGAKSSTRAPHSSCRQHWQSAEMEYRGSISCQSAREPHAVLRQEEVVPKQNRNPFISPIYAFSGRIAYSMFLLTPGKLTSGKRPFLKKVPHLQGMGMTKQVFIIPGHQGNNCSSDTGRSSQRNTLRWGSKNNSKMRV